MLLGILLTLQIIVCAFMVAVILLQKSEGGALGIGGGGGGGGFMTARGAGNLLTRMTGILAGMFFLLSISLTIIGNMDRKGASVVDRAGGVQSVDPTTLRPAADPAQAQAPATGAPGAAAPSLGVLEAPGAPPAKAPATETPNP